MEGVTMPDTPERRPADVAPPASRATQPTIHGNRPEPAGSSSDVGSKASQAARESADQVKQQTSRLAEEAKKRGRRMLDEQKGNAVQQLSGIAKALHQSAEQCKDKEDQQTASRVLEQAATALDRMSEALRNRDVDSMIDQATTLMRRQPALFVGGSVLAGFLLTRFLKSSGERDGGYRGGYGESGGSREGGYSAEPTYDGRGEGASYVTSAHANPGEVSNRPSSPPVMPTGRRDF
jgi:23S rRNA pseudoU1915 N3-methylase RlmH